MHFCQKSTVKALRVAKHVTNGTAVTRVYIASHHTPPYATTALGSSNQIACVTHRKLQKKTKLLYNKAPRPPLYPGSVLGGTKPPLHICVSGT